MEDREVVSLSILVCDRQLLSFYKSKGKTRQTIVVSICAIEGEWKERTLLLPVGWEVGVVDFPGVPCMLLSCRGRDLETQHDERFFDRSE